MAFTSFLFAEKNSMDSVKQIQSGVATFIDKPFVDTNKQIKQTSRKENLGQMLNPFRLLDIIITDSFEQLLVISHSIAYAATGDRFPGYEKSSLTGGAFADYFIDKSYMGGHGHDEHSHEHEHDHQHGKLDHPHQKLRLPLKQEDDSHHHTIPTYLKNNFLNPLLHPLRLAAIYCDSFLSQLNNGTTKPRLSTQQAYEKYFPKPHKHEACHHHAVHAKKPRVSTTWIQNEITWRANKERMRIKAAEQDPAITVKKLAAVSSVEKTLLANLNPKKYRHSVFQSTDFANRMKRSYPKLAATPKRAQQQRMS